MKATHVSLALITAGLAACSSKALVAWVYLSPV